MGAAFANDDPNLTGGLGGNRVGVHIDPGVSVTRNLRGQSGCCVGRANTDDNLGCFQQPGQLLSFREAGGRSPFSSCRSSVAGHPRHLMATGFDGSANRNPHLARMQQPNRLSTHHRLLHCRVKVSSLANQQP